MFIIVYHVSRCFMFALKLRCKFIYIYNINYRLLCSVLGTHEVFHGLLSGVICLPMRQ